MKWSRSRLVFVALLGAVGLTGIFAYYQNLIAQRKQTSISDAASSLAEAANLMGDKLADWQIAVRNAAKKETPFENYVRYLMPALQVKTCDRAEKENGVASLSVLGGSSAVFRFQFGTSCAETSSDFLPSLLTDLRDDFDSVLIASDNGDIQYQSGTAEPHITSIGGLLDSSSQAADQSGLLKNLLGSITTGDSKSGAKPASDPTAALPDAARRLRGEQVREQGSFPNMVSVRIAGEDYLMFLQPIWQVSARLPDSSNPTTAGDHVLLLVGFLSDRELDRKASTWPTGAIGWVLLGLLFIYGVIFALSCVPMKPRAQPVRSRDVILMGVSVMFCCACLTLAVTHSYFSEKQLASDSDHATQALSTEISNRLRDELCRFYHLLKAMSETEYLAQAVRAHVAAPRTAGAAQIDLLEKPEAGESPARAVASAVAYTDPFFDYILWSDPEGTQIAKWTTRRAATRPTSMKQFSWFVEGMQGKMFELRAQKDEEKALLGSGSARLLVTGDTSINTGEFLSILMETFTVEGQRVAGSIVAPLTSVNAPVMPPGYGFDVVERDGTVLFSSNSERNKRGNLLQDCGPNQTLSEALQTSTGARLDANCSGTNLRMLVSPFTALDGANWSIITTRDMDGVLDSGDMVFVQTMTLMIPYLVIGALAGLLLRRALGQHGRRVVWPSPNRFGRFRSAIPALVAIGGFGVFVLRADSRSTAYFEMMAIPILAVLIVKAILRGRRLQAVALAFAFPLLAVINTAADDLGLWLGICQLAIGILGVGLIAALTESVRVAGSIRLFGGVTLSDQTIMGYLHATTVSLLLFICAALPVLCCYRVAYEIGQTSTVMRDLIRTSDRLADRTQALHTYYSDINKPPSIGSTDWFVRDWLANTSDRYDFIAPGRTMPYVECDSGKNPKCLNVEEQQPRVDAFVSFLGSMLLTNIETPRGIVELSTTTAADQDTQFFLRHRQFVQLDSANHLLTEPEQPTGGLWSARSLAARVSDTNPFRGGVVPEGLIAGGIVFSLLVWLVRTLFFIDFEKTGPIQSIAPKDLQGEKRSLILLHLAGVSLDALRQQECIEEIPCPEAADMAEYKRWLSEGTKPVLITDLDLGSATQERASAWLEVLEYCVLQGNRNVILSSAVDPVRYVREAVHPLSTLDPAMRRYFVETESRWARVFLSFDYRLLATGENRTTGEQESTTIAHRIYASCTDQQSALLYQIASNSWCNPNNRDVLRSLVERGWVTLRPLPKLSSGLRSLTPSLTALVTKHEVRRWEAANAPSHWRVGVTLAAIVFLGVLLFAGRNLLQSVPGAITLIGGAVAPLWKAFSNSRAHASLRGKAGADA